MHLLIKQPKGEPWSHFRAECNNLFFFSLPNAIDNDIYKCTLSLRQQWHITPYM